MISIGLRLPAPYVDDYGESDMGLKRGNPLKLDASAYDDLQKMWLGNGIPDRIARAFDDDVMVIKSDWNLL